MRTVSRLRLLYLLFTSTPLVLPFSLSRHVETKYRPIKKRLGLCLIVRMQTVMPRRYPC